MTDRHRMASRLSSSVLLAIAATVLLLPAAADCREKQHVLVLHSYHKGLRWTDREDEGISSVLKARGADVEVHTEYMDTKRVSVDVRFDSALQERLKHEYASVAFSVIICSDDDAYHFLVDHGSTLFPGVPFVFCGVNDFNESAIERLQDSVTGVVESYDVPSTIRIALIVLVVFASLGITYAGAYTFYNLMVR